MRKSWARNNHIFAENHWQKAILRLKFRLFLKIGVRAWLLEDPVPAWMASNMDTSATLRTTAKEGETEEKIEEVRRTHREAGRAKGVEKDQMTKADGKIKGQYGVKRVHFRFACGE